MRRAAVQRAQMNVGARGLREALKKIFSELRLEIANTFCGNLCVHDAVGTATEIDGGRSERFIHGHEEVSGAQNSAFRPQRFQDGLPECDAHIFDGVVLIDIQIAFRGNFQIERAVARNQIEHVIEEANARGHARSSATVEIQLQANVGFISLAVNGGGSGHGVLASAFLDRFQELAHLFFGADGDAHEARAEVVAALAKKNPLAFKLFEKRRARASEIGE